MWQGFLIFCFGLLIVFVLGRSDRRLLTLLFVAYGLRLSLALIHAFVFSLPDSQADAITFERVAAELANQGWIGWLHSFTSGAYFYSWLVALFYILLGRSSIMAQLLNVLAGTITVYFVYKTSTVLWGRKYGLRAGWLVSLFPLSLLYSAITMRESFMLMFFTLGLWGWVQSFVKPRMRFYIKATVGLFLATVLHTAMIGGFFFFAVYVIFLMFCRLRYGFLLKSNFFLVIISFPIICVLLIKGIGLDYIYALILNHKNPVSFVESYLKHAARGRALYLPHLIPHSWEDLLWMTPLRMIAFLFSPLWSLRSMKDFLGFLIALIWLFYILYLAKCLKYYLKTFSWTRWFFAVFLAMWTMLSLGVSNYGTALRHSLKLLPTVLIMVPYPGAIFLRWRKRVQCAE